MQEPKPFSAEFERLYAEYLGATAPGSWEAWVAARDEDQEPATREVRLVLTVTVPDDGTTDEQVTEALNRALDEPGNYGNDWGQWIVGGVSVG